MKCLLGLLFVGACARQPLRTVEAVTGCATSAPQTVTAPSAGVSAWRAGRYRVVQVITSLPAGRTPYIYEEGELRLTLPTPEQLAASKVRGFGRYPRRDLLFLGTWSTPENPRPDVAEVDGDTLHLGLRTGFDVSPIALRAEGVAERRVWGSWRDPLTGFAIVADPVSQVPIEHAAGLFCAEWLGP